jgi:hypothetical protein
LVHIPLGSSSNPNRLSCFWNHTLSCSGTLIADLLVCPFKKEWMNTKIEQHQRFHLDPWISTPSGQPIYYREIQYLFSAETYFFSSLIRLSMYGTTLSIYAWVLSRTSVFPKTSRKRSVRSR